MALLTVSNGSFSAHISDLENKNIERLKSELTHSGCQFERNGKIYSVQEAISHINKKQQHHENKIDSAVDFINYAASKSIISGKSYYMVCKGAVRVKTSIWLLNKLKSIQ